MGRITIELLRKRSEHNAGILRDLQEITLHQFDIEKIELLNTQCRQLKLLYLQNNLISKIENLNRLKELTYLNLALNNITKIENLGQCEMLRKLDLTVNFIDCDEFEASMQHLQKCDNLRDLYMTGNPVFYEEGYRHVVIEMVPQLKRLDGAEISKTERLTAHMEYPGAIEKFREKGHIKRAEKKMKAEAVQDSKDAGTWDPEAKIDHSPEARYQMYKELEAQKEKDKEELEAAKKFQKPPDYVREARKKMGEKAYEGPNGELPRMRNLNKLEFTMDTDGFGNVTCVVEAPKHLDTSQIEVDVHPLWFQVLMKGKSLLLHLDYEVCAEEAIVRRLVTNGYIEVIMPKLHPTEKEVVAASENRFKVSKEKEPQANKAKVIDTKRDFGDECSSAKPKAVDLRILKEAQTAGPGIVERKTTRTNPDGSVIPQSDDSSDFEDDSDVPPLE